MNVRVGLWRKLSAKELMLLNCGVGEDSWESLGLGKEIQLVHPKGDQSWVFFGMTDAKADTPILWPPHAKHWLIGKVSDVGRDWGQEEKGTTEDEMAGWHYWLNGRESEWTLGVGDGLGGLACFDSWGHKESDTTERLNWSQTFNLEQMMQGYCRRLLQIIDCISYRRGTQLFLLKWKNFLFSVLYLSVLTCTFVYCMNL